MNGLTTVHLGLTRAQAEGVVVLAGHAIERAAGLFPDPSRRCAAERGLVRLRGALQGLRPGDVDLDLEALGASIAGMASVDAKALFTARVRDALDGARLWRALEEAYRVAIRDDAVHVDDLPAAPTGADLDRALAARRRGAPAEHRFDPRCRLSVACHLASPSHDAIVNPPSVGCSCHSVVSRTAAY